jgi:hypothetical protein
VLPGHGLSFGVTTPVAAVEAVRCIRELIAGSGNPSVPVLGEGVLGKDAKVRTRL